MLRDCVFVSKDLAIARPDRALGKVRNAASGRQRVALQGAVLLLAALALRGVYFGNPVLGVDEQFYLLVGDRMLQGAVPFIDIWDRKPIGLFLIYGAIRLLGGEGIYQYQIVATLFAAGTAFVAAEIAARFARRSGAIVAGIAYLIWLNIFGGEGGQSPVFYNLFMAVAVWLVLRTIGRPQDALIGLGCGAMLLAGVAIQTKYTAVFEGIYFGCALLWFARRAGFGRLRLLGSGAIWAACGLLPTALALLVYLWRGESEAFLYANFLSVFERSAPVESSPQYRLLLMAARLLPLMACAALSCLPQRRSGCRVRHGDAAAWNFAVGWALVATAAVLVFGTYYMHYALPLIVPLAVVAAPFLSHWRIGPLLPRDLAAWRVLTVYAVCLFGLVSEIRANNEHRRLRGSGAEVRAMAEFIRPRLQDCLFVFDGEPILYDLTGSCLPSRYAFPSHLNDANEAGATGVDQLAEVGRILANHPHFVVSSLAARPRNHAEVWMAVEKELSLNYRPVMEIPVGRRVRVIHQRLDTAP
jgi:hypothetical protein